MAQTTYLSYLPTPSGKRLVVQQGRHAFTTSASEVTLTINMRRVLAAQLSVEQPVSGKSKTAMLGGYLPFVSMTMMSATKAGTPTNYRFIASRKTGSITGLKFSYLLVGW
jgi:hypothetical protein